MISLLALSLPLGHEAVERIRIFRNAALLEVRGVSQVRLVDTY